MDIFAEIIKSRPLTAFRLNSTATAYVDLTNRGVTLSGTPPLSSVGTVAGSIKAPVISSGTSYNFSTAIFTRSQERRGFTLQASVAPLDTGTGFISVLSHNGVEDGIYIKNNRICFTIEFNTMGSVTVSTPWSYRDGAATIHAIYSVSKVQLYVDGKLADEKDVSAEQVADGFKTRASSNLYIGQGAAGKRAVIEAIAVYSRSLESFETEMHYLGSRRLLPHLDNSIPFSSIMAVDGGENSRSIFVHEEFNENWSVGIGDGIAYTDSLFAEVDQTTGLTKAGTWTVPIQTSDTSRIYGVVARWDGEGSPVVELTLDAEATWIPMASDIVVPQSFDVPTASADIRIRVKFPSGETFGSNASSITSLSYTVYKTPIIASTDANRTITATAGATTYDRDFGGIIGHGRIGLTVSGNYSCELSKDVSDETSYGAIEMWVKFDNISSGQYVYDLRPLVSNYLWLSSNSTFTFPSGTLYVNGVSVTSGSVAVEKDVWYHVVHVLPASVNQPIILGPKVSGGDSQYGIINLYTALTAAQIMSLFKSYTQIPSVLIAPQPIPVTEIGFNTYQYEWAMTMAGG